VEEFDSRRRLREVRERTQTKIRTSSQGAVRRRHSKASDKHRHHDSTSNAGFGHDFPGRSGGHHPQINETALALAQN